jgi:uncharacterized protein YjiS (DUF1127 family)
MLLKKRTIPEIAALGPLHIEVTNRDHVRTREPSSFAQHLTSAWSRCLAWWMGRQIRLMLRSLDDRMLADIGLRRSDMDAVLYNLKQC